MDYDRILKKIGGFGWWQKKTFLLVCLPAFISGMVVLTTSFSVKMPTEFVCYDACEKFTETANVEAFLSERIKKAKQGGDKVRKSEFCHKLKFKKVDGSCTLDKNLEEEGCILNFVLPILLKLQFL